MRRALWMLPLIASVIAGFAAPAPAAEKKISGAELKVLLDNATMRGTTSSGSGKYTTKYLPNGTMSVTTNSGYTDSGTWVIEGDRYCSQWQKGRKEKLCYDIFAEDGFYKLVDEKGGTEFSYIDKK